MRNKILIGFFAFSLVVPFFGLVGDKPAYAADANFMTSVDVMKYTKDTMRNQFSDSQIDALVGLIMTSIKPKYIAISVPLDSQADYPADGQPAPRTAAAFTQKWADSIHAHGGKVIFRGTWSGIEGIYGFAKMVGAARFPAGTAASAATDGTSTWLGKTYQYIKSNSGFFHDGDIWAVLPERTEGICQDSTSFLTYASPGIQSNYPNFFLDLNKVSAQAFGLVGKKVKVGYSANNFSEVASGWLNPALYQTANMIVVDHYGINHSVSEMESDLTTAYKKYGKPVFLQEWGDYWNVSLPQSERSAYLKSMYAMFAKLAGQRILAGFNYWGGWINDAEGIITSTNGKFALNYRGQLLADFFASFATVSTAAAASSSATASTATSSAASTIVPQSSGTPTAGASSATSPKTTIPVQIKSPSPATSFHTGISSATLAQTKSNSSPPASLGQTSLAIIDKEPVLALAPAHDTTQTAKASPAPASQDRAPSPPWNIYAIFIIGVAMMASGVFLL